jgi:hypothetical protein
MRNPLSYIQVALGLTVLLTWFSSASSQPTPPAGVRDTQAQPTGTLQLVGLPRDSRVYIDGVPVGVRNGSIVVAAGEHMLQIEAFSTVAANTRNRENSPTQLPLGGPIIIESDPRSPVVTRTGVLAFRTCMAVAAGQVHVIAVQAVPVFTSNAAYAANIDPRAPQGPRGPTGRSADLTRPLTAEIAGSLLRESIRIKLLGLDSHLSSATNQVRGHNAFSAPPEALWYSPHGERAALQPVHETEGPWGESGPPGLPGDVRRLFDEQGEPILDRVSKDLGIAALAEEVKRLEERSTVLRVPWYLQNRWDSIPIYTSGLRTRLNSIYTRYASGTVSKGLVGLSMGAPQGPRGAPGPNGPVETSEPEKYRSFFSEEEVERIVAALRVDPIVQDRIKALEERIKQLNLGIQTAEERSARMAHCPAALPQEASLYPGLEIALQRQSEEELQQYYQQFLASLDIMKVGRDYTGAIRNLLSGIPARQEQGLSTLGASGQIEAIAWIVPLLDASDHNVRGSAGAYLEKLVTGLAYSQRDNLFDPRSEAIRRHDKKYDFRPLAWVLLRMIRRPDDGNTHAYAATMVGYIGLREFTPLIQEMLKSRHPAVVNSAASALERLKKLEQDNR